MGKKDNKKSQVQVVEVEAVETATVQNPVITLTSTPASNGKKQVIPAQVHAAAAALTQKLVLAQADISGLIAVAKDFAQLQSKLLALQPVGDSDYKLAQLVPNELRPNGIASAQSVRCKSFKSSDYVAWIQATYEEIILRHGFKAAKSTGTKIGLTAEAVNGMDLEQVKSLLNSRASTKCNTDKWTESAEKTTKMQAVLADIELLTARRKQLDPAYKQPKAAAPKPTAAEVLTTAGIDAGSEQGKALLKLLQLTV